MQAVRDIFDRACTRYASELCLGKRPILKMRMEGSQEKYVLGEYRWINYREAHKLASDFGRGLRVLGVESRSMVNFFAETSQEWQLAAQGCFQQGIIVTTTYSNSGASPLQVSGSIETDVFDNVFADP